jgi:leucyl aminopeptidase (aminopeptidase T)
VTDTQPEDAERLSATNPLARPAAVAAERLGITSRDRVVVLHNGPEAAIATALATAAGELGSDARIIEFPAPARSGIEPPSVVKDALHWADAGFGVTSVSISHTRARIDACAAGLRFASMGSLNADIFTRALVVDYAWMSSAGAELARLMTESDTAHVTSAEGTDVTLSLAGRGGRNDDGDLAKPGAFGNLPAGEAYIAPVEDAGSGTIVFDGALTGYGLLTEPLAVHIEGGSVVGAEGAAAEFFLNTLDSAGPSGRRVAEFAIGTNPAATVIGVVLEDEKVLGTAHIAFGTSTGVGGVNQSTVHVDGILRRPAVDLGTTRVLEDGHLLVGPALASETC